MSQIEYSNMLFEIGQGLDKLQVQEQLLFMCRREKKRLEQFEREVIRVFSENSELEHLIRICERKTSFDYETNIRDVRTLFNELESQDFLEFDHLDVLKEILRETRSDLLKEVENFERRVNEEEELESEKARTAGIFASGRILGGRVIGGKDEITVTESMFVAAKSGNITRLENLLSRGHDVNSKDDNCVTPLRIAVLYRQSETVRYLLEKGADPFVKGNYKRNLLHLASYGGQVAIIDEMIKQGLDINSKDGNGDTPLILAAAFGGKKAVKYLLQRGADPTIKGYYGRNALHAGNDVAIIEILLSSGVHIDTKDADGNTPLIMAAANANGDAVNYLLTKGADQDVKGRLGRNTLHAAAQGGDVVIVETMLSHGLHINSKDSLGDTPLIIASACGKLEAVCLLLVKGAKPLITGQFGRNPLHAAAQCGHAAIIEKLLFHGAGMINSKDNDGNSPLRIATTSGKREAVQFLLDAGADLSVNMKNRFDTSLLHAAAKGGDVEIIKTMLSRGLDANSKDSDGRTPLMIAELNGKTEAVAFLLSKEGR
ncbi:serine/threonine-protein phosphatase 6 regulatory ankyrin repeat subunit B-like [Stylophora pistillata]|uniref:Ankyrin repeat domain-containing protein 50 n=1 Tax=Stylophora pistillata TaxID=50429 RepID=A0A2B4R7G9_STYPI|nr:serine/threonine-protein phosphatase 6 regulatory ankyrin repeat subunit B-like [Stylophora pistillata]PFX12763.1 Ankyrin repeat domain-containing protein 50 [Stylophora pistillata]